MAESTIDIEDLLALVLVPFIGGVALGLFTLGITIGDGYELAMVLWSGSGVEVTLAAVLTVAGFGWVLITNEVLDGRAQYETWEWGIIAVGALAVPAYVLVPPFSDLVNDYDVIRLVLALVQSGSLVYTGWTQ
ncbi:hypothetical protein [Haloprofundus salinisoli]|uniref:hypothetical protein n=1 Tax=Haloprofundus salinisoli TaxID=2876193 RepID=UPI001CCAD364|nr:hypothetical protein [Haloprofundus salinisoli]